METTEILVVSQNKQDCLKEEADAQGLVWSYGKVKEVEFNFGNVVFWVHIHTAKSLSIC